MFISLRLSKLFIWLNEDVIFEPTSVLYEKPIPGVPDWPLIFKL